MPDPEPGLVRFFRKLVARPVAVLMAVVAILGMGGIAASRMTLELMPSGIAGNNVSVVAPWIGANPTEIEKQVVRPLEEELRTIQGIREIIGLARESQGMVIIEFPGTADMDLAYAEVADRVERVRPNLPSDVDRVFINRFTTADLPIMWCGLLYDPENAEQALNTVADYLRPRLESIDGIANVDMHGLNERQVRILLDEDRVQALGIDIGELVFRLQQDNVSVPVGDLDDAGSRFIVRVDGRFDSIEEIENWPVRQGLTISDIGRVVMDREEATGFFRISQEYGIGMAIFKESSANTFDVCKELKRVIEEEIPDDPILGQFDYKIFFNVGETIRIALTDLVENAAWGGLIACAVLMMFLRRLRYTLLIALSIPFSVVCTLAYLYFAGSSFNMLSMVGITISIGMLVDNSVVFIEAILRRREQGQSLEDATARGPADVMLAVVTATLTTVVVFVPMLFMTESNSERVMFQAMGLPLCFSLLAALLLAVVIVPVAARHLAGRDTDGMLSRLIPQRKVRAEGDLGRMGKFVGWSLNNRFLALGLASIFLMSMAIPQAGNETTFTSGGMGGELEVDFEFPANTTLEQAEAEVVLMEKIFYEDGLQAKVGNPTIGIEYNRRGGEINLWHDEPPSPEEERKFIEAIRDTMPKRAEVEFHFGAQFVRQNTEDDKWIQLVIEGPESRVVREIAEDLRVKADLSGLFEDVADNEDPNREVLMSLDRERMQRMGVTSQRVLGTVEWALRGFQISRFQTSRTDIPIKLEFDEVEDPDRDRLAEMSVAEFESGASLPLGAFAEFEHRESPRAIFRRDGRVQDAVGLKPKTKDVKEGAAALRALMAEVMLPEGYRWRQAGGNERFEEGFAELADAFKLAVALVFFLMGLLFESLLLPLSVLLTIPFAIVGAMWSFRISGEPIDLVGMIGYIVLAGVVVNNGIVLLDRIIRLRERGMDRETAILQGVADRVRPVAMTAATTICGLLPIAFTAPTGNSISFQGLAIGVAGGLACTTFFTLWVVPLAYSLFDDLGMKMGGLFKLPNLRLLRRKSS